MVARLAKTIGKHLIPLLLALVGIGVGAHGMVSALLLGQPWWGLAQFAGGIIVHQIGAFLALRWGTYPLA